MTSEFCSFEIIGKLLSILHLIKKNRNLDDCEAIVKQVMDDKAEAVWQVSLFVWESDKYNPYGYKPLKHKESHTQKNSEAKKNHFLTTNNNSGNGGRFSQAFGQYLKNVFV